jgi:hypothetical protein
VALFDEVRMAWLCTSKLCTSKLCALARSGSRFSLVVGCLAPLAVVACSDAEERPPFAPPLDDEQVYIAPILPGSTTDPSGMGGAMGDLDDGNGDNAGLGGTDGLGGRSGLGGASGSGGGATDLGFGGAGGSDNIGAGGTGFGGTGGTAGVGGTGGVGGAGGSP